MAFFEMIHVVAHVSAAVGAFVRPYHFALFRLDFNCSVDNSHGKPFNMLSMTFWCLLFMCTKSRGDVASLLAVVLNKLG